METLNIGDAMVFIDIGCPIINGGCKSYVINEMFRNVLGTSLGEFNLKTEGYDFYELGTGSIIINFLFRLNFDRWLNKIKLDHVRWLRKFY